MSQHHGSPKTGPHPTYVGQYHESLHIGTGADSDKLIIGIAAGHLVFVAFVDLEF